ncbi:peptidase MA family metallohydrolase [Chloroflexota bacterium]
MINRASLLGLIMLLLATVLVPGTVQAQQGPDAVEDLIQSDFPDQLTFKLSAESSVDITDIHLHYMVEQTSFARVTSEVYLEFEPDTQVDVEWTWEMKKIGGLPSGTAVVYWWTIEDADGAITETSLRRVQFDDTRYSWRDLTEGKITIYWYESDESFADELMTATQQALTRLKENTGAYLEEAIGIYIYDGAMDLRGAMIYPQEWMGGVAFPTYGTIALGIAPGDVAWGKRAIAHELTHLVVHQLTLNPYGDIPTWLDEGLAMYNEGPLEMSFVASLGMAVAQDELISVRSLSSPFSAFPGEAVLSYAQSHSLVEFLVNSYGQEKILLLLLTFKQGSGYDAALEKVYGFDMDSLDALWRDYVAGQYQTTEETTNGVHPALIGMISALATWLLLASALAIEAWAWRRDQ